MALETANFGVDISTPQIHHELKAAEVGIKVDKIRVTIYFEHAIDEYERFPAYKWSVLNGDFDKKGILHKTHPSSAFTSVSQPLSQGGCLFIRYGYSHKMFKAIFEFNPNHVDMTELHGHLSLMLHHGYWSLLERGIVTKCEFAVDVKDVKFKDHIYLDHKLRSGSSGLRFLGSDYVGSRRSNRRFLAYDKRKQLLDTNKGDLGYDLLRVEARFGGAKRFPLKDIAAVESPFKTFKVIDRHAFEASTLPAISKLRDQLPYNDGCLQLAYCSLTPKHRQQAEAALSTIQPGWWQPNTIWASFPHSQFVATGSTKWLH